MCERRANLSAKLGRRPTAREMAEAMDMPIAQYLELAGAVPAVNSQSLSQKWENPDFESSVEQGDFIEDERSAPPEEKAEKDELREVFCHGLDRKERLVLTLYYYEEMSMKSIGQFLGLSESRVSQVHAEVIGRLRKVLAGREAELVA
jgi:RNA polymerase sigma factor for flagellar operon FliA